MEAMGSAQKKDNDDCNHDSEVSSGICSPNEQFYADEKIISKEDDFVMVMEKEPLEFTSDQKSINRNLSP